MIFRKVETSLMQPGVNLSGRRRTGNRTTTRKRASLLYTCTPNRSKPFTAPFFLKEKEGRDEIQTPLLLDRRT
jgi:hypothetical protein